MSKIGLTGVIGSGKTTVLRLFAKLGAKVFDSDQKIHQFYQDVNHPVYKKTKKAFPEVELDNKISRKKLAELVFNDRKKLEKLEEIVHPEIIKFLKQWLEAKSETKAYIAEVPLLFEKNLQGLFDKTILVKIKENILVKKLKEKYNFDGKEIKKRLSLYLPSKEKEKRADFILTNNLSLGDLEKEVSLLWHKINKI
ncbi:MAG: dephospho-CoA kinase [Candidatus Omnitrophica bacterium]|nr:dephospho-CoA kinase [Candidatus Omnitrophota bacterium]MCF7894843.1 dephospho-CoA kinase [Candidatus Omnitrophota bacterium]